MLQAQNLLAIFVRVVKDFLSSTHTTPRKKTALQKRGLSAGASRKTLYIAAEHVKKRVQALKAKKDSRSLAERRVLVSAHLISKKYRQRGAVARAKVYLTSVSKMVEDGTKIECRQKKRE